MAFSLEETPDRYSGLVEGVVKELNSAQPFPQERLHRTNLYRFHKYSVRMGCRSE